MSELRFNVPPTMRYTAVFTKSAALQDKSSKFSFCPAKTFSLSDKCPVNLSKENNIMATKMPSIPCDLPKWINGQNISEANAKNRF